MALFRRDLYDTYSSLIHVPAYFFFFFLLFTAHFSSIQGYSLVILSVVVSHNFQVQKRKKMNVAIKAQAHKFNGRIISTFNYLLHHLNYFECIHTYSEKKKVFQDPTKLQSYSFQALPRRTILKCSHSVYISNAFLDSFFLLFLNFIFLRPPKLSITPKITTVQHAICGFTLHFLTFT